MIDQTKARTEKAITNLRAVAVNITTKPVENSKLVQVERGELTGTIAGQKVHNLTYQVRTWDDGEVSLHVSPACGTTRHARQGGHYVNYYSNLGRQVTCSKCQAK
jgi:hypothetical protein